MAKKRIVNRSVLLGEMAKSKIGVQDLADILHISYNSLWFKLKHNREFKENEIAKLLDLFDTCIFFRVGSSQNENED